MTDTPKEQPDQSAASGSPGQPDTEALIGGTAADNSTAKSPPDPEPDNRADCEGRLLDEAAGKPVVRRPESERLELEELGKTDDVGVDASRVTMLNDVNLQVKIELGRTRMLLEDILKLGEGSLVELDKLAGDPVDVFANDRLIARGEVLVLNDSFCVRISEVVSEDPHRVSV